MQAEGFDVVTLKEAEKVKQEVEYNQPNLILMDIMLAGKMTGIEAVETIREFSNCPVIFLSALTDKPTIKKINSISNAKNLAKPFDQKLLIDTVRSFLFK